jgi:hydroxymethylbilane synthase
MKLRLGTRKSELALFQANYVCNKLSHLGVDVEIIPIISEGDIRTGPLHEIGGKGLFVNKLEEALLKNEIDCAVHSLKDVPARISEKFIINAVMPRESYADILVKKHDVSLLNMPDGAKIGTSSPRRAAQILNINPNLRVEPIRGNIATRLSKLNAQDYDAIIVAEAALNRLEIVCEYSSKFKISEMLPSASQGYIGIQCLNNKSELTKVIESINSKTDMILANAERSFVAQLDGSCTSPICILCTLVDEKVRIQAKVISLDGKRQIAKNSISSIADLDKNIVALADQFISEGARSIIL